VEPIADLLARMELGGPYRYEQYRILPAEPPELVIKPTCYGCGLPAGFSTDADDERLNPDRLVDFDEDHQLCISIPIEGKKGKRKMKSVAFCSVRCADLALLELTRKGPVGSSQGIVRYGNCQTLGEYRAAQGYKRCPACRAINRTGFCGDVCRAKCEADLAVVLEVAEVISASKKPKRRTRRDCAQCGLPFLAKRADARYCSDRCRTRASRCSEESAVTDSLFPALQGTDPMVLSVTENAIRTQVGVPSHI